MPAIGELRKRLQFEQRPQTPDDGYGNTQGGWRLRFACYARIRPSIGSETVIASRLAGIQPVRITVRSNPSTQEITTGWRAVDIADQSRVYNITAPPANIDEKNAYLDIMATVGVPT